MPAAFIGPTWSLVELNGQPAPLGAGDRPATLIFEAGTSARAAGFAGCNRWSSAYAHIAPDKLQFTAPLSTKMACPGGGMELEQKFLEVITKVREYALADTVLTLRGEAGAEAKFVRR
jgi:heat shock protein HslJ